MDQVLARALARAKLVELTSRASWANDPVAFAWDVFGVELWERQAEIAKAVAEFDRVAARSGHKIGKTKSSAIIAVWWTVTRHNGSVIVTAPTHAQIKDQFWKELTDLCRTSRVPLPKVPLDPGTGLRWPDGRFILGVSTNAAERMAGYSGAGLLFIVDEASGVEEHIYEAIEGNCAGGAHLFLIGNPTQTSGKFFDAFHSKRPLWHTIHVSSEDTPNVREGRTIVEGLATRKWVAERAQEWGEDSPLFQVRVRGNFPDQASCSVIPLSLVEAARRRIVEPVGGLELGVDVARFGDDESVIFPRIGNVVFPAIVRNGFDETQLAGLVLATAREMRVKGQRRPTIKVDACGGYGTGVAGRLRDHDDEVEVIEVNVAEASSDPDEYFNLRSQVWFGIADWLRQGGAIPNDEKLVQDLVSAQYKFDNQGRRKVEPKDEIKKRLGRSPDRADALALAIHNASPPAIQAPKKTHARWSGMDGRGFG